VQIHTGTRLGHSKALTAAKKGSKKIVQELNRREGSKFHILIPFAIETLGSWGNEAKKFVQSLSKGVRSRLDGMTG